MTRAPKPKAEPDDITAFVEALAPLKATSEGEYTFVDRYRDFSRVFGTDEGQRVLRQIVSLGDRFVLPGDNEREAHWKNAQRFLVAKILEYTAVPPRAME